MTDLEIQDMVSKVGILEMAREIERRTLERAAQDLHYRFYYSAEDVVRALMEQKNA